MRILGVDPGLTRCGLGVIDTHPGRRVSLVWVGVTHTVTDDSLDQRLLAQGDAIEECIDTYAPEVVAIERVFAQHNQLTVTGTAQVSGIAILAAARRRIPVALHTPTEVKAAVTGSGSAGKEQVAAMVTRLLRLEQAPRPADASDALALAICHAWRPGGMVSRTTRGEALTSAQRAWAEAERRAKRAR